VADGLEVERKWLIEVEPPATVLATQAEQISQGYLTVSNDGSETRIRSRAGEYILTVKSGIGLVRSETSVLLTRDQFDTLWPVTARARVEKSRRLIAGPDDTTIELDIYTGDLSGLIVAEVEFDDPDTAETFTAPGWFGPEVTDDDRYKNRNLATRGRPA
jgi:adenylate cyclase